MMNKLTRRLFLKNVVGIAVAVPVLTEVSTKIKDKTQADTKCGITFDMARKALTEEFGKPEYGFTKEELDCAEWYFNKKVKMSNNVIGKQIKVEVNTKSECNDLIIDWIRITGPKIPYKLNRERLVVAKKELK